MEELARLAGPEAAQGRIILAHLGNGASLAAALGGLDTQVFAGGIGEKAPTGRARICDGRIFLGVELEESQARPMKALFPRQPSGFRFVPFELTKNC